MALFTLKEAAHYHSMPPLSTLPWIGERSMTRTVTFSPECAYDSAPYNSEDVNKLFGLSFGFGGVHHNSARFGWRWSKADQCIELLAYCYVEGVRNQDEQLRFPVVAQVRPGQKVQCDIIYDEDNGLMSFSVLLDEEIAERTKYIYIDNKPLLGERLVEMPSVLRGFGLTHGLYFGGALPCPHDMAVRIDR